MATTVYYHCIGSELLNSQTVLPSKYTNLQCKFGTRLPSSSHACRLSNKTSRRNVSRRVIQEDAPIEIDDAHHILVQPEKITQIFNRQELDAALSKAGDNLVVVKYGASHSVNCARIYPTMVELSQRSQNVEFLLIVGDDSPETEQLCRDAKIESVPHFQFLRRGVVIHEEKGVDPEQLFSNVMYYSDNESSVIEVSEESEFTSLLNKHKKDHQLVVLDIGLNHCGPCAKVWPAVVKLANKMEGSVVFAKMDGDSSASCRSFLKKMEVREVPTFLFYRDGEVIGRYIGSGRGDLIGEVLRYQGVQCT